MRVLTSATPLWLWGRARPARQPRRPARRRTRRARKTLGDPAPLTSPARTRSRGVLRVRFLDEPQADRTPTSRRDMGVVDRAGSRREGSSTGLEKAGIFLGVLDDLDLARASCASCAALLGDDAVAAARARRGSGRGALRRADHLELFHGLGRRTALDCAFPVRTTRAHSERAEPAPDVRSIKSSVGRFAY